MQRLGPDAGRALRVEEPLAKHTSFRIGGPADLLLTATSDEQLAAFLGDAAALGVPVTILGGGTNVLVADGGVRGLVVRLGREFEYRRWTVASDGESALLEVGAAARLARVRRRRRRSRLRLGSSSRREFPASVGGGALMNAGAFGGELGNAIEHIAGVSLGGERRLLVRTDLEFSYRKLALPVDVVVTSVRFRLSRSPAAMLRRTVQEVQAKRRGRQPSGFPNAGSIFKNPAGEFAGRLIEQAGLKGTTVGKAQVSPDHANFIVNLGGARARDVRDLMSLVQGAVWRRSGIWLEPEVRLVGDWDDAAPARSQVQE